MRERTSVAIVSPGGAGQLRASLIVRTRESIVERVDTLGCRLLVRLDYFLLVLAGIFFYTSLFLFRKPDLKKQKNSE